MALNIRAREFEQGVVAMVEEEGKTSNKWVSMMMVSGNRIYDIHICEQQIEKLMRIHCGGIKVKPELVTPAIGDRIASFAYGLWKHMGANREVLQIGAIGLDMDRLQDACLRMHYTTDKVLSLVFDPKLSNYVTQAPAPRK